jgi:polar amino acid transport system substrate-binding protein
MRIVTAKTAGRMRLVRLLAAMAAFALLAAACNGDDDDVDVDIDDDVEDVDDDADDADDAAAGNGLLADLQEAGVVTVGIANEVPYGFEDEQGNITGQAPEVARAVLAELGIDEIEAEIVDFGALIPGLEAGQFDMTAAGMFITRDRADQVIFADPDYCVSYAFAVPPGNPDGIEDFSDIADTGATLAVLSGAVDEDYAEWSGVPSDQIELYGDVNAQYQDLMAGRVDAVGGTSLTVQEQVAANEGEMEATDFFFPVGPDGEELLPCGAFAFVDQEFRDAFNEVMIELREDGTLGEITMEFGFAEEDVERAQGLTVQDVLDAEPE